MILQIKTFSESSLEKLEAKVNEFCSQMSEEKIRNIEITEYVESEDSKGSKDVGNYYAQDNNEQKEKNTTNFYYKFYAIIEYLK